ncbi:MAG: NAD(P)-dependent oxidoreductase [Planctomycetota bacterium]|nr:NAD(P)-dependent oxidoreductase [Planctomycetota bacterium]
MSHQFLFRRSSNLESNWPFVPERLLERLQSEGEVLVDESTTPGELSAGLELDRVSAIANFAGSLKATELERLPNLRVIGGVFDNASTGTGLDVQQLQEHGIAVIDATRGWAQSVAECAFALALCALRGIPQWHCRMSAREPLWVYEASQFCDNSNFVNGELGTKNVGVMGLGQIGRRIAQWCVALGAEVAGFDPYLPQELLAQWQVSKVDLDALVDSADIVFVAIPPTPSSKGILNRERIGRLRKGALVNIITRAHSVDMAALRERILANELIGAFDVYDVEPLPVDDPLRNRANVVHTPHIAGRTRDANIRVADIIADDFIRIVNGQPPQNALTPRATEVRNLESPEIAR